MSFDLALLWWALNDCVARHSSIVFTTLLSLLDLSLPLSLAVCNSFYFYSFFQSFILVFSSLIHSESIQWEYMCAASSCDYCCCWWWRAGFIASVDRETAQCAGVHNTVDIVCVFVVCWRFGFVRIAILIASTQSTFVLSLAIFHLIKINSMFIVFDFIPFYCYYHTGTGNTSIVSFRLTYTSTWNE